MAIHACLLGNAVDQVIDVVGEDMLKELFSQYTMVLDLSLEVLPIAKGWRFIDGVFEPPIGSSLSPEQIVQSRIRQFQQWAPDLILDLYVTNTLAGITTEQSDQMFSDYSDVLIRLREGAWPTALFRLSQKSPSGFVTQQLIDDWTLKITTKMSEV